MAEEFNKIFLNMLNFLYEKTGNTKLRKFYLLINNTLEEEENKNKYIENFIIKVLQYKDEVFKKNDTFFLNLEIESSLFTNKEVNNFKQLYKSLNTKDKNIIIDNFIKMTILSENYFLNYLSTSS
jgi:hypothetical protein